MARRADQWFGFAAAGSAVSAARGGPHRAILRAILWLALRERLARGELFSLMRDYVALGGRLEWSALWSQELTLFGNLHDGSVLAQVQFGYERGDHQRLQFGAVHPFGNRGEEFGGVPVAGPNSTAGGGTRLYARWGYYF